MKLKWWLLLGLFGGLVLGPLISKIPGSTYILLDKTAIEFKNNVAFGILILTILVIWLLWLLVRYILRTSNLTVGWFGDRGLRKARRNTIDGMIALAEGHWKTAENLLSKSAKPNDTQLINYLAAARAAQEQNNHQQRDGYLKAAAQSQPDAQIAVGLTQAQLQIQHQQYEQALATLNHLRSLSPHHPYVLKLLNQLLNKLGDWQQIIDIMPKLRKNRVLSSEQLDANEINAWNQLLLKTAQTSDFTQAHNLWLKAPKLVSRSPESQLVYAEILAQFKRYQELELHIKDNMKKQWQEPLAKLFSDIQSSDPNRSLAIAEQWLKTKPANTTLLTTLGKLALNAQLWGKAKSYLEQSLQLKPCAESYFYLAKTYEATGHPINAQEQYQLGLATLLNNADRDETLFDEVKVLESHTSASE